MSGKYRGRGWKSGFVLVGWLISISVLISRVNSIKFTLTKLTPWQRETIEEMRRQVQEELPHEWMSDDLYLAKWLSAKNFHMDEAIEMMREDWKWRKQNYMDSILKEDWREMEGEFPYELDTVDRHGQPLLYLKMGDWNVGRMSNMLRLHNLARYFSKIMEEGDYRVRRTRAISRRKRQEVSQINVLINMEGYSLRKHACIHCFQFFNSLTSTLQAHYPRAAERVVFVNAPGIFQITFDSIHRYLNMEDQQTMELFGTDRNRWEARITDFVERSQFPRDLAIGIKESSNQHQTIFPNITNFIIPSS